MGEAVVYSMNRWKSINRAITKFVGGIQRSPGESDAHDAAFWDKASYAWWWMLIPIAGIAGFYITVSDANKYADQVARK
jgi:hypothetical protein